MKTKLEIKNLSRTFGNHKKKTDAIRDIGFTVNEGEFVSIVGPSGCGKSTLINLIAGFDQPTEGEIVLDGNMIQSPGADRGVVFQKYTCFPWQTVQQNVEFGLKILGTPPKTRAKIAHQYIKTVGLAGFENEYPKNLSGGMQQRVALARSLATNPKILLMDEPFGALDTQTRRFMQDLLLQIWEKTHKTILFVTHDVDEAIFMADKVLIMSARPGTIKEKIDVKLKRPRNIKVEFSQEYINLKKRVQKAITEESIKSLNEPISEIVKKLY
ncbi:MAG: ABC transporter ATP-binding protein [Pseudomonadota bacterium]